MKRIRLRTLFTALLAFGAVAWASAQSGGTGSLSGRIFNPATGEYVRNAEIQIEGTSLTTYSRFNRTYELTASGRNILNEPIATFANSPGLLRVINRYGASWTFGVRGRF